MDEGFELLDWYSYGVPADVEVRAYPMGMITFQRGKAHAAIDTTDMTRDEVVRSIAVALAQLDQQAGHKTANRETRRRMEAESRRVFH
jgi:hypothetical protein